MPRGRDTEIHRDTQKHVYTGTERDGWEADGGLKSRERP